MTRGKRALVTVRPVTGPTTPNAFVHRRDPLPTHDGMSMAASPTTLPASSKWNATPSS